MCGAGNAQLRQKTGVEGPYDNIFFFAFQGLDA